MSTPPDSSTRSRSFATSLGTRESRTILGTGALTGDDVRNPARRADSVGVRPELIDGDFQLHLPITGRFSQVPYGVVPQRVDGMLAAGRRAAGDQGSHAATRHRVCCFLTGQAAGVASALSLQLGVEPRLLDVVALQAAPTTRGVRLA